ncbi:MAG: hypothetical protein KGY60_05905 [Bacteroidales bacterium]|nr:hypothetical protein [Bacteroidales bacterium]
MLTWASLLYGSNPQGQYITSFSSLESDTADTRLESFINEQTEGQWFLGYRYGELNQEPLNQFTLKRGYITIKNRFSEHWSVRFTQDITLDQEGSDRGNVEMRLKYCYINYQAGDFGVFTDPQVEAGLVHRPWLDFEQKINSYRVQGTMFLERVGLMNSADFGLTFSSLLGGEISERYQKEVNDDYPGRYGSFSVGIYNGGGYHALEYNQTKNLESRLTLRPFPASLPGLQFTYNLALGKGNTELAPDFLMHSGFISYELPRLTLTGQYYEALGNSSGSYANTRGGAYHNEGYSFFAEYKIPHTPLSLFGRYDHFLCGEVNIPDSRRAITGVGYNFYRQSKLVLDVDALDQGLNGNWNNQIYEAVVEIRF